ncbi:hypothetical protein Q0812_12150 [Brevundimonas sp. 2R-24]|uniref:DUF1080 domain-containing protein n=1 Tax=Peiella sedimenti TaxID=3061083 RepID=A0ABT8SQ79_9CAUL|nr:hypothetical protein [Caulobacteraceae bacterium XZ-24]
MRLAILILGLLGAFPVLAQPVAAPFDSPRWDMSAARVERGVHLGRPALRLQAGMIVLPDADFRTGVIEFDIALPRSRGFSGVVFRGQDAANYENVYFRPHQSGNPDASQYQPVINGSTAWQILYGEAWSRPWTYRFDAWMPVRVEVYEDSALVSIDGQPPLHIGDLLREPQAGFIGLSTSFAEAWVSDFRYEARPMADPRPREAAPADPDGTVRVWQVSQGMAEAEALALAATDDLSAVRFTPVEVEARGIANLARASASPDGSRSALARLTLYADRPAQAPFRFGFSDKASVFLNGRLIYRGDDTYGSRDYRFLGTVGLYDTLLLDLRPGANELVLVVSDEFGGGWAVAGVLEPTPGVRLR